MEATMKSVRGRGQQRGWSGLLSFVALLIFVAGFLAVAALCATWPLADGGATPEDFKRIYESAPPADPACTQCSFP